MMEPHTFTNPEQLMAVEVIYESDEINKTLQNKDTYDSISFIMYKQLEEKRSHRKVTISEALKEINLQPTAEEYFVNILGFKTEDIKWSLHFHRKTMDHWFFDIPVFEDGEFKNEVFASNVSYNIVKEIVKEYFSKGEFFYYFQEYMIDQVLRYCQLRWKIAFSGYYLSFLQKYKKS